MSCHRTRDGGTAAVVALDLVCAVHVDDVGSWCQGKHSHHISPLTWRRDWTCRIVQDSVHRSIFQHGLPHNSGHYHVHSISKRYPTTDYRDYPGLIHKHRGCKSDVVQPVGLLSAMLWRSTHSPAAIRLCNWLHPMISEMKWFVFFCQDVLRTKERNPRGILHLNNNVLSIVRNAGYPPIKGKEQILEQQWFPNQTHVNSRRDCTSVNGWSDHIVTTACPSNAWSPSTMRNQKRHVVSCRRRFTILTLRLWETWHFSSPRGRIWKKLPWQRSKRQLQLHRELNILQNLVRQSYRRGFHHHVFVSVFRKE